MTAETLGAREPVAGSGLSVKAARSAAWERSGRSSSSASSTGSRSSSCRSCSATGSRCPRRERRRFRCGCCERTGSFLTARPSLSIQRR